MDNSDDQKKSGSSESRKDSAPNKPTSREEKERLLASARKLSDAEKKALIRKRKQGQSDKTQIAPSRSTARSVKTEHPSDVTRIAKPTPKKSVPPKAVSAASGEPNDKTRIAAQRTRVKPGSPASDKTQILKPGYAVTQVAIDSDLDTNAGGVTDTVSGRQVLKGRFVLEKVLGAGGMGIVHKAKDLLKIEAKDRDPFVAIKVLGEEFKSHPEAFISLQRESRKSQRIAHPNIVNVHDFDKDGDTVFMTMEFLDGRPLDKLIRQYKATGLPEDDVQSILRDICAALLYAHNQEVIHSDFKPGNIFVTNSGTSKVFDFGIARAVAKAEQFDSTHDDKTVFDAGNLGALTPAYASLEMLEGKTPDIRDDIYALGCIAYEMHTGNHPFNKVNAVEAKKKKLKPKKITSLKKYQWQAIEKALAFSREDRIASVEDFWSLYNKKFNPIYLSAAAVIGLLAVGGFYLASYIDELETRQSQPDNSEEVRNELESQIRLELAKSNLDELILNSAFDEPWENAVWNEFQNVSSLLPQADEWLLNTRATLGAMYIGEIDRALEQQVVDRLPGLLSNAARYITESALLEEKSGLYAALVDAIAEQEEADRIEAERLASQQQQQQQVAREAAARRSQFNIAYQNVEELLVCQNKLDMRDLEIAVNKLRSVDMARYRNVEKNIVTPLSNCITEIGLVFPDRATEIKRLAMRLFRGNTVLANTRIVPRDPCDKSLAGLGKQGKRAACRDKIKGIGNGPELVVIPARGSLPFFAVSKYEVSIQEFNQFCNATSQCKALTGRDSSLPVTGVSIKQVNEYISWLNKLTDKNYRLPTRVEWNYAARANSREMDPNRNCELSTRGIQKGGVLLKTEVGGSNAWGIVNHLGNAAELLKDKGNKLLIAGGSYSTPMQQCNFDNIQAHDGRASEVVGFRLLREI